MKNNLTTKHIKEFTTEDTIYITRKSDKNNTLFFCEFISYNEKTGIVTAKAIDVDTNKSLHKNEIDAGLILSAKLDKCALYGSSVEDGFGFIHWFVSTGRALDPLEEYKIVENQMHIEKHPSFGLVSFNRSSGGNNTLFGSSIQHSQTISLKIKRATHERKYNNDWYHGSEELIEINLSQNQFAELITSFGMGEGIPCTLKYVNRERMPEPPYKSKVTIVQEEFDAQLHNFGIDLKKIINNATDILKNKSTITKGDRELIINSINKLVQEIQSNIPFVADQFKEQMDKTITEAKSEIEAFTENKIRSTGIDALKLGFISPTIPELKENNNEKN
jgi:hypothetical protein